MNQPNHPLLSQLKDIHLPIAPSFWPLAPGWYLVIALSIGGLGLLGYRIIKRYRANLYRRRALLELKRLAADLSDPNAMPLVIAHIAILLKRTALAAYPHCKEIAGLTGEAWLAFLDQTGNTSLFTKGAGRVLLEAPYQKNTDIPLSELIQLARQWITSHHRSKI